MPYFIVILICKISETYEAFFYFSRALSLDKYINFSNLYFQDLSFFFSRIYPLDARLLFEAYARLHYNSERHTEVIPFWEH